MAKRSVSDTGHGMSAKTVERAVEPFFTTKPRGIGTGLGLATVHGSVKRAGGFVDNKSEPGRGTHIDLMIPLLSSAPPRIIQTPAQRGDEAIDRLERVLVVEDHKVVAGVVKTMLETFGFHVSLHYDAECAWEEVQGGRQFDLLLTDVVLPGMNGIELARRVSARSVGTRILLMTGYQTNEMQSDHGTADAFPCLSKPFSAEQLQAKIGELNEPRSNVA